MPRTVDVAFTRHELHRAIIVLRERHDTARRERHGEHVVRAWSRILGKLERGMEALVLDEKPALPVRATVEEIDARIEARRKLRETHPTRAKRTVYHLGEPRHFECRARNPHPERAPDDEVTCVYCLQHLRAVRACQDRARARAQRSETT